MENKKSNLEQIHEFLENDTKTGMSYILLTFHYHFNGNWAMIYKAIEDKVKVPLQELLKTIEKVHKEKIIFTAIGDSDYPITDDSYNRPPFVIIKDNKTKS